MKTCSGCSAVVDCGLLDNPENGFVTLFSTSFRSVATYECLDGYTLEGDSTRTCQADATWSGSEPTCRRKTYS